MPGVPPTSPEEVSEAFAAAINSGDVQAALELWSEQATIVRPDGGTLVGRSAIAGVLETIVGHGTTIELDVRHLYRAGGVAIALGTLRMSLPGRGLVADESSVVVYSRAADGSWRVAIDAPWGLPAAG